MRESTASRFRKRDSLKTQKGASSTTTWGIRLLNGAIGPVSKELERMSNAKDEPGYRGGGMKCLRQVDPKVAALLAIQQTIDDLSERPTFNSLATRIGRLVDQERRYNLMAQDNEYRYLWRWLLENTKQQTSDKRRRRVITAAAKRLGAYSEPWPSDDSFRAGALLLRLIGDHTGLITFKRNAPRNKRHGGQKWPRYVEATPECLEWIEQARSNDAMFLEPVKLPCVVTPFKWTSHQDGGYTEKGNWGGPLIKSKARDSLDNNTALACPEVYNAVNRLQSVPYRINQPILKLMETCRDKGLQVGGLPTLDNEPLPSKPVDMDDLESRRHWRRRSRVVHENNVRSQSLRIHVAKLLYLARRMETANLHYVHTMDFRGRFYSEASGFLQPMGNDWARGLLEFGFGKSLDDVGVENLAITGANLYGVGGTYDERLIWTMTHSTMFQNIAHDPLDHLDFWQFCDKPWQFLAFVFEWYGLMQKGTGHESHLICHRDATCNGLQIFSMLLRDEVGGKSVNLIDQDKPADAYTDVADKTMALMRCEKDPELSEFAEAWLKYGVPRGATKRALMITPYNGSLFSAQAYVEEWYEESRRGQKKRQVHEDSKKALRYLGQKIWAAIDQQLVKSREAMDWFSEVATICTDSGYQMRWHTPSKFLVCHDYLNMEPHTVKTILGRKAVMWHSLQRETQGIHKRRARNSLSPNYIHSLDAAALTKTINSFMGEHEIDSFSAVHDSYGCLAQDVGLMNTVLREQWQSMFMQPLLETFREDVMKDTGLSLPALPAYGSLDLDLPSSKYFFN